ncbi:hypothetical protein N8I77_003290 [Diaporthe amygdali]|uniref:Uncharacterized protein n=1 Tax=Phomopsis amygdali TaxID=1214568 RepID=A0AAD9SJW9_PHOAM|nr:hypothetical protein N8I77_003290 [Diaporthe amygdali]
MTSTIIIDNPDILNRQEMRGGTNELAKALDRVAAREAAQGVDKAYMPLMTKGEAAKFFTRVVSENTNAQRKPKFLNHGYQQDGQPLNFWCNPDLKVVNNTKEDDPLADSRFAEQVLQKYHKKIKPDAKKPIKTVYMIRDNPESDICGALNVDETWKLT